VNQFATGLEHPRFLYVLPNGDVLVAESNGPPRPEDDPKGIRGWFMKRYFKKAGASVPSPNKIILLRDADGDGVAETHSVLLDSLYSPFGIALVGGTLYVANADALLAFPYRDGDMHITVAGRKVTDLPGRPYNHHWTESLIASPDGTRLYVGVGSNSNVAEHGIEAEADRASIWEIDPRTGSHRVFATGLRNPAGLAWEPQTNMLWASVNVRIARRRSRPAATTRSRRESDCSRLRARPAHGIAWARVVRQRAATSTLPKRHVRRAARFVEPETGERLQGDFRALREWPAKRCSDRRAH